jgi:hypothetical protein
MAMRNLLTRASYSATLLDADVILLCLQLNSILGAHVILSKFKGYLGLLHSTNSNSSLPTPPWSNFMSGTYERGTQGKAHKPLSGPFTNQAPAEQVCESGERPSPRRVSL